jgi:hypothetical protein
MHLTQLKTIVIFFQEVTLFVIKRASCITSIMHAGNGYYGTQFFGGKFTPRFSTSRMRPPPQHDHPTSVPWLVVLPGFHCLGVNLPVCEMRFGGRCCGINWRIPLLIKVTLCPKWTKNIKHIHVFICIIFLTFQDPKHLVTFIIFDDLDLYLARIARETFESPSDFCFCFKVKQK